MSVFSGLAQEIFEHEFDSNTGVATVAQISGWLSTNLGALNTAIYTDFTGLNPDLQEEEKAIFKELYLGNYYSKQARNAMRGILTPSNGAAVLSLTDGDQAVTFVNKNEVGKTYRGLAADAYTRSEKLIHAYNSFRAAPRQLGGYEAASGSY